MIESFFQRLEQDGVEYLLISGQAAVLYGAAVFSEDIDLWVQPTSANLARLHACLAALGARYYKLTPPLEEAYARSGLGFHFTLGPDPCFLDVMGNPPRVGAFPDAFRRAVRIETEWGVLPVVGILDLVELKKTQRLEDYSVISRLATEAVRHHDDWIRGIDGTSVPPADSPAAEELRPPSRVSLLEWAIDHTFVLDTLAELLLDPDVDWNHYDGRHAELVHGWRKELASGMGWHPNTADRVSRWMQQRMTALQSEDRAYWRPIIGALKQLKHEQKLMPVGSMV